MHHEFCYFLIKLLTTSIEKKVYEGSDYNIQKIELLFLFYSLLLPCSQVPRLSRPLLLLQKKVRESSLSQKKFQKRIGKKFAVLELFLQRQRKNTAAQNGQSKKISSNYSRPFFRPNVSCCCNRKTFLNSVMQIEQIVRNVSLISQ